MYVALLPTRNDDTLFNQTTLLSEQGHMVNDPGWEPIIRKLSTQFWLLVREWQCHNPDYAVQVYKHTRNAMQARKNNWVRHKIHSLQKISRAVKVTR